MKKILCILLTLMLLLSIVGCNRTDEKKDQTPTSDRVASTTVPQTSAAPDTDKASPPIVPEGMIQKAEDIASYEGVTSFSKYTGVTSALNYDFTFLSDDLSIHGMISLPKNYLSQKCPVVLYFHNVGGVHERIAQNFAANGFVAVGMDERGFGTSEREGDRDFTRESLVDAQYLLNMITEFAFCDQNRIYTVGGGGVASIYALRLMTEDTEGIIRAGAVSDVLVDFILNYEDSMELTREGWEIFFGGSPEEVPEKYKELSVYYYADKIKVPLLVVSHLYEEEYFERQGNAFVDKLKEVGADYEHITIPQLGFDFISEDEVNFLLHFLAEQV